MLQPHFPFIQRRDILDWVLMHPEDGLELIRISKEAKNGVYYSEAEVSTSKQPKLI